MTTLDPHYQNEVKLLLPCDYAGATSNFVDYSPSPKTVIVEGSAVMSGVQALRAGGTSLHLHENVSNNLLLPTLGDWALGGTTWTFELWLYLTAYNSSGGRIVAAGGGVLGFSGASGIHWLLQSTTAGVQFQHWTGSAAAGSIHHPVALNSWTHYANSYDGAVMREYINGALSQQRTVALASPASVPALRIGRVPGDPPGTTQTFTGYLQDIRLTKGAARYTTDFTPPPSIVLASVLPVSGGQQPLAGNVTKATGGGADTVIIRHWQSKTHVASVTPAGNGDWSAEVPPGDYDITYLAAGCAPVCHGPYTLT